MHIEELTAWTRPFAILFEGGAGPAARPPLHLQAAHGGYLRLVGNDGVLLWGRVQRDWFGVDLVRGVMPSVLEPLRDADHDRTIEWWTRWFAEQLLGSPNTPLATGRRAVLTPATPRVDLELLRDPSHLRWEHGNPAMLLLRALSPEGDGRVKMWRKLARRGRLPPIVAWWCGGLAAHVVLDGHDRLHAAVLEGVKPTFLVLADLVARPRAEIAARHQDAIAIASQLEQLPATAINSVLGAAWDPRLDWDERTPGFPLDLARWRGEVRGTALDASAE